MIRKKYLVGILLSVTALFLFVPIAMAHAPLGTGDNEKIGTAAIIPDPTKSWAIYSALNKDGDPQYYTFNVSAGQKIHVLLFKAIRSDEPSFEPTVALMGPSITGRGTVPEKVTVPAGASILVVSSGHQNATYEPFSPGSFYALSDETVASPVSGTYYIVVYEGSATPTGGHYGLAVGDRETYTIDEWILIPLSLLNIFQWEGQNIALILVPMIATLTVGIILVAWALSKRRNLSNGMAWLGSTAGLLFVGSGAITLYQMSFSIMQSYLSSEVLITLVFAVIPIVLGILALRLSLKHMEKLRVRKRIYLAILGVAALFIWAGLFVGPALAIIASIIPTRLRKMGSPT